MSEDKTLPLCTDQLCRERRGEVINGPHSLVAYHPRIVGTVGPILAPTKCPMCGSDDPQTAMTDDGITTTPDDMSIDVCHHAFYDEPAEPCRDCGGNGYAPCPACNDTGINRAGMDCSKPGCGKTPCPTCAPQPAEHGEWEDFSDYPERKPAGESAVERARDPRKCADCGKYPADEPSPYCPGCEAYKEHTDLG